MQLQRMVNFTDDSKIMMEFLLKLIVLFVDTGSLYVAVAVLELSV